MKELKLSPTQQLRSDLLERFNDVKSAREAYEFIVGNEPTVTLCDNIPTLGVVPTKLLMATDIGRKGDGVYLIAPDHTLVKYGNPADYKGLNGPDFKGVALIVGDMAIRIGLKDQEDVTLTNKKDDGETGSPYYCDDWDQARIARPNGQADTEHIKAVGTDIELEEGWYIPSLFELYMIFVWRKVLDAALEFIGADPFEDEWYWSSTECSATLAWFLDFTYGHQGNHAKASGRFRVRPVSAL